MRRWEPTALVAGYAVVGSLPPLVSRWMPPTDVAVMLVIRFAAQFAILSLIVAIGHFAWRIPSRWSIWAGVSFAAYSILFFKSLELTDISHAIILSSVYPIEMMLLMAIAGKVRITAFEVAGTIAVTVGTFTLWTNGGVRKGDLLALASSIAFAGYILCNGRVMALGDSRTAVTHQTYVSATCAVITAILTFLFFHGSTEFTHKLYGSWEPGLIIAGAGVLSHLLLTVSQRYLNPLVTSIAAVSSPVIATLIGAIVFDHTRIINAAVGSALCAAGLFIVSYRPTLRGKNLKTALKGSD